MINKKKGKTYAPHKRRLSVRLNVHPFRPFSACNPSAAEAESASSRATISWTDLSLMYLLEIEVNHALGAVLSSMGHVYYTLLLLILTHVAIDTSRTDIRRSIAHDNISM